ncbi:MAG: hypothetical protein MRY79_05785 [Alphaproteobacteria bacterium]|nr:hypothetical protein [Alphaproteobacteria bacterium]
MKKHSYMILCAACIALLGVSACSDTENRTWDVEEYSGVPYTHERTAGTGFIYVLADLLERKGPVIQPIMERTKMLVPDLLPKVAPRIAPKPLKLLKGGKGAKGISNKLYLLDETRRLPESYTDVNNAGALQGEVKLIENPGVQEVWERRDEYDIIELPPEEPEEPEEDVQGEASNFLNKKKDEQDASVVAPTGIKLPDLTFSKMFPKAEKLRKKGEEPLFKPRVSEYYQ